jgi:hypothetical protein
VVELGGVLFCAVPEITCAIEKISHSGAVILAPLCFTPSDWRGDIGHAKHQLPDGVANIAFIVQSGDYVRAEFFAHAEERLPWMEIIGMCLNALYQAATCHRKCRGGGHVLERLCGRAYNMACAAYQLTSLGLYDEALTQVRGLGELTNLVALTALDPKAAQEWINADRGKRITDFGPSAVRKRVKKISPRHLCMDDKWYIELSEGYVHITPQTQPNFHGDIAFVGMRYEQKGCKEAIVSLMRILTHLCVFVCPYFELSDLSEDIGARLKQYLTTGT